MLRIPLPSAAHSGAYIPEDDGFALIAMRRDHVFLGASLMSLKSLLSLISSRLPFRV